MYKRTCTQERRASARRGIGKRICNRHELFRTGYACPVRSVFIPRLAHASRSWTERVGCTKAMVTARALPFARQRSHSQFVGPQTRNQPRLTRLHKVSAALAATLFWRANRVAPRIFFHGGRTCTVADQTPQSVCSARSHTFLASEHGCAPDLLPRGTQVHRFCHLPHSF
jgi:hypothetical protein